METLDAVTRSALPFAVAWCAALLMVRTAVVLRRGYRVELGVAKGSARRGVLYSLTFSMLPWKKDSTRRHVWTYVAGMAMHAGVFFSLLYAAGLSFFAWPEWARPILAVFAGAGFVATLGLFLKRRSVPHMRVISSLDDFVANTMVQLFLLGAVLTAVVPDVTVPSAVALWRSAGILLLLYVPLGKIYHMLLFFVSRALFGLQFGRRGVLQHDVPISY